MSNKEPDLRKMFPLQMAILDAYMKGGDIDGKDATEPGRRKKSTKLSVPSNKGTQRRVGKKDSGSKWYYLSLSTSPKDIQGV